MEFKFIGNKEKYLGLKIEAAFEAEISWKENVKTSKSYVEDDLEKRVIHFTIDGESFKAFDKESVFNYERVDDDADGNACYFKVHVTNYCQNFDGLVSLLRAEKSRKWKIKFLISGYCGSLIIRSWEVVE